MRFTEAQYILFLLFFPLLLFSQSGNKTKEKTTPFLTSKDSLTLKVEEGKKYVFHRVKPKQTLFSLAKFYGLSLQELYEFNPDFETDPTLTVGSKIKIPIPNLAIKRYKTKSFALSKNVPIYYQVEEGDNLYQICKRYFDMPVDTILKRNKLKTKNIRPGQLLLVAWLGTEGIKPEWRKSRAPTPSSALKTKYESDKSGRREIQSQGICFWTSESNEKGYLYALHREADIGTVMAVINPRNGKIVYAKVIGRIPGSYERSVEVVLAPAAAKFLGATDSHFFVRVKFLK